MISKRLPFFGILPFLVGFAITGTMLCMVGCGDFDSPVAGETTQPLLVELPPLDGVPILAGNPSGGGGDYELMPWDDESSYYVSETLDWRGGEVVLQDIALDIPNNAIPRGEEVDISILIPDPTICLFDLGPNNYVFRKDIRIRVYLDNIDLEGIDPENIVFMSYDEESGMWISEGGKYKEKDNYIEVKTDHFSYWALASD